MPKTPAETPVILPFVRPTPSPVLRFWRTFELDGRRYRFEGRRWLDEDTRFLGFQTQPDPHLPGTSFSVRMIDVETGDIIEPFSCEAPLPSESAGRHEIFPLRGA